MNGTGPAAAAPAPNVRELVTALARAQVRYVLTGSVAAAAWTGRAGEPGDLDIAPDLEPGHLARLARLLAALQARPVHRPEWKRTLSPEACSRWRPNPPPARGAAGAAPAAAGRLPPGIGIPGGRGVL